MISSNTPSSEWKPIFTSTQFQPIPREVNLIELDPPAQTSSQPNANVINITLDDLTGGEGFGFQVARPKSMMDVINYLDKCNERHTWLMSQVTETRLQCQRLMYIP